MDVVDTGSVRAAVRRKATIDWTAPLSWLQYPHVPGTWLPMDWRIGKYRLQQDLTLSTLGPVNGKNGAGCVSFSSTTRIASNA